LTREAIIFTIKECVTFVAAHFLHCNVLLFNNILYIFYVGTNFKCLLNIVDWNIFRGWIFLHVDFSLGFLSLKTITFQIALDISIALVVLNIHRRFQRCHCMCESSRKRKRLEVRKLHRMWAEQLF
jgi:hypothetical protein